MHVHRGSAFGGRVPGWAAWATLAGAGLAALLAPLGAAAAPRAAAAYATVYASGLNAPRGLTFAPDGSLYVAEGGTGGTNSTDGQCDQVIPPVGPYTGGTTGRISKISPSGQRSTVVDGLPSTQTGPMVGGDVSSVGDVEMVGGTLYAVLTGAGCSHGVPDVPNGVIKISTAGTWTMVSDLSAFVHANPVQKPSPFDFEPDGDWYSLEQVDGNLYVIESNHGELDKIVLANGGVSRVADVSATLAHAVPTAVTYHDGNFYVGTLVPFPPTSTGQAKILQITPSGQVSVFATGLTTVLGVAFDAQGQLYALESISVAGEMPTPGTGRVVRVTSGGTLEPVATGLTFPTAMTFGPDGMLYVSNFGYASPPGSGQIVRIDVNAPAAQVPAAQMPSTAGK